MPQSTSRRIPGLTASITGVPWPHFGTSLPNDPDPVGALPDVVPPELFDPSVDLTYPRPTSPMDADVEGTGMPEAASVGPVPGLSWRWSGQPPSASDLAKERVAFLADAHARQAAEQANEVPQVDFDPAQETIPGRPVGPGTRVLWSENDVAHRGGLSPDEWTALNRPDVNNAKMAAIGMQTARAQTPEGQAAERARRIEEADTDLYTRGMPRAKRMGQIGVEQAMVEPNAFMRPESVAARGMASREAIANEDNPAYQANKEREFQRQLQLHGVDAYGRVLGSSMGGILGGTNLDRFGRFIGLPGDGSVPLSLSGPANVSGGGPPAGPAGGAPAPTPPPTVPQSKVEAYAQAQNPRLTFDQALAAVKAEGFKVQMNDGSIR